MALCASWITDPADLCAPCAGDDAQEIIDRWGMAASALLYALSGRQFGGICTDTVSPNIEGSCGQTLAYAEGGSRPIGGCSDLRFGAGACAHASILLPHRPVRSIVAVTIDGVVVDPGEYRLRDRRWLVRCSGSWPSQGVCGDFTVEYEYGVRPPAGGAQMAGVYACELQRACDGDDGCRLPKNVQSIVQEGISQTLLVADPIQLAQNRMTGLPEVDNWVRAQNPNGIDRAGKVLLPRRPQTSRLR